MKVRDRWYKITKAQPQEANKERFHFLSQRPNLSLHSMVSVFAFSQTLSRVKPLRGRYKRSVECHRHDRGLKMTALDKVWENATVAPWNGRADLPLFAGGLIFVYKCKRFLKLDFLALER